MALKKKTIDILYQVATAILEEPKRLDMEDWGSVYHEGHPQKDLPPCNTKGCLAGWTIFTQKPRIWKAMEKTANDERNKVYVDSSLNLCPSEYAEKVLGISEEQAGRLFYFGEWGCTYTGWPRKFSRAYNQARTAKQRAKVTAQRIQHFVATGGEE